MLAFRSIKHVNTQIKKVYYVFQLYISFKHNLASCFSSKANMFYVYLMCSSMIKL